MLALGRLGLLMVAAATCLCTVGCRSSASTSLHVTVALGPISTEQLEFSVLSDDGSTVVVPTTRRPNSAAGPLASPQDVYIYLPDVAQTVTCRVASTSVPLGAAEQLATITPHQTTEVALTLAVTVLDNGQHCTDGGQCASTYCVDGMCCDSACDGTCMACDVASSPGTCTQVPAGEAARRDQCATDPAPSCGTDGKCDGQGACSHYPIGMECAAAVCTPDGKAVMSASRCDGMGKCVASTTSTPCDPYLCDSAAARCRTSCVTTDDCAANPCIAAKCGKKPNSDSCNDGSECNSGHCSDGVCCNVDCAGACTSCNVPGAAGICSALPAGAVDQHQQCNDQGAMSCGTNGLCNGTGACQLYPASTVCAPAACSGTDLAPARVCDGQGTCVPTVASACPSKFACDPANGVCFTSCTTKDQCIRGAACHAPKCM